jgi:histidinol-phosphate/aromatic aminotransferase/cobyric acid decarboxylase-like protein
MPSRCGSRHSPQACRHEYILELARPDIRELQPYQHASWDPSLERLHANDAGASGDSSEAGLNRYPEPQPQALVAWLRITACRRRTPRRTRQRRSDRPAGARVLPAGVDKVSPTFGYYKVAARIQSVVVEVPLRHADFSLIATGC